MKYLFNLHLYGLFYTLYFGLYKPGYNPTKIVDFLHLIPLPVLLLVDLCIGYMLRYSFTFRNSSHALYNIPSKAATAQIESSRQKREEREVLES